MDILHSLKFEMDDRNLYFDSDKSILLCKTDDDKKNVWVKKLQDVYIVNDVIEDEDSYYFSCEVEETTGYYLSVTKGNGSTKWFIPGKAYFQIIYNGFLYLIFIDEINNFYLLKVNRTDGSKVWFHKIEEDLAEYSFRSDRILLSYLSGNEEVISPINGSVMNRKRI